MLTGKKDSCLRLYKKRFANLMNQAALEISNAHDSIDKRKIMGRKISYTILYPSIALSIQNVSDREREINSSLSCLGVSINFISHDGELSS